MTTNLKWIAALLLLATAFLTGLFTGREQIQDKWNLHKLEMAENAVRASEAYRLKEQDWNKQLQEAQNNAIEREKILLAGRDAALASVGSLRNTVADLTGKLSRATADARLEAATTGLALFGECAEAYVGMAEAADRHANDVRALTEAWPARF